MMTNRKNGGLCFLLIFCGCGWWSSTTQAITPRQPIGGGSTLVADWVNAKSGGGQQLWKYQGALYDPLDGRRVASVEGVEWVSLLQQNETVDRPIYSQVLQHPNATWNFAATMWSKHVFCYTMGDGNNHTTLLRKIRIRPYSPEKNIPLNQAVAVYETATTFIERPNGEVLVHSEWPSLLTSSQNNKTIHLWGVANPTRNPDDGTMGFSVYCKRRSTKSPLFLPDLTQSNEHVATDGTPCNVSYMVVSPKRAKWIEFGISNMETKHKFGARETYTMNAPTLKLVGRQTNRFSWFQKLFFGSSTTTKKGPSLRYTRYGEGPPFYAPGRMCMLELQAEPIETIEEASPVVQRLLQTQVQGWKETHLRSWETEGLTLRLLPDPDASPDRWEMYKGHALAAWGRVRSVTNVVSLFRREHGFWRG